MLGARKRRGQSTNTLGSLALDGVGIAWEATEAADTRAWVWQGIYSMIAARLVRIACIGSLVLGCGPGGQANKVAQQAGDPIALPEAGEDATGPVLKNRVAGMDPQVESLIEKLAGKELKLTATNRPRAPSATIWRATATEGWWRR